MQAERWRYRGFECDALALLDEVQGFVYVAADHPWYSMKPGEISEKYSGTNVNYSDYGKVGVRTPRKAFESDRQATERIVQRVEALALEASLAEFGTPEQLEPPYSSVSQLADDLDIAAILMRQRAERLKRGRNGNHVGLTESSVRLDDLVALLRNISTETDREACEAGHRLTVEIDLDELIEAQNDPQVKRVLEEVREHHARRTEI